MGLLDFVVGFSTHRSEAHEKHRYGLEDVLSIWKLTILRWPFSTIVTTSKQVTESALVHNPT